MSFRRQESHYLPRFKAASGYDTVSSSKLKKRSSMEFCHDVKNCCVLQTGHDIITLYNKYSSASNNSSAKQENLYDNKTGCFTPEAGLIICISQDQDMAKILNRLNQLEMKIKHLEGKEILCERRISDLEDILTQRDEMKLESKNQEKSGNRTISDENQTVVKDSVKRGLRQRQLSEVVSQTAFHVRLSRDITSINKGQIIVFDHVVLDTGNAYSTIDGEFAVPVNGIYVFYWNILTNGDSQMDTTLKSTQGDLGYGYVDKGNNGYANGGNMVIAKMNQGARVWLIKADTYGQFLHERFSTFSGFLLYEMF